MKAAKEMVPTLGALIPSLPTSLPIPPTLQKRQGISG